MRIITDSAADFTNEELQAYDIDCVRTQVMFGDKSYTPGVDLSEKEFWDKLMVGENAKTSQPSPEAFLQVFERIKELGEEAIYICVSSSLSGTMQGARLAASMLNYDKLVQARAQYNAAHSLCGDLNMDSTVNQQDITKLKRHLAGWNEDFAEELADVNSDGKADAVDAYYIVLYYSERIAYFPA